MATVDELTALAQTSRVLSVPIRLAVLSSLLRGEASVSDLAARLDADPHRLSYHLAQLRVHGLVTANPRGRLFLYSVQPARVRAILAVLRRLPHRAPLRRTQSRLLPPGRRRRGDLRQARTCFDHLGGAAGVYLMNELLRRRWLIRREDRRRSGYVLTMRGAQGLMRRRVNVIWAQRRRRRFALACPDWSARHAHLGGALGAALLAALQQAGVVRRDGNSRRVLLGPSLGSWFGEGHQRAHPTGARRGAEGSKSLR